MGNISKSKVYVIMVLILGKANGGWEDFYSFNSGIPENKWYLSIFIMLFAAFLISLALRAIQIKAEKLVHKKYKIFEGPGNI